LTQINIRFARFATLRLMGKRIVIIQGHPDACGAHFCDALATEYARSAGGEGHEVRTIEVARLAFPLLHSAAEWEKGAPCDAIREAQQTIAWADHLLIVFPLWLGDMPALLKGFFEQAFRPGFAIGKSRLRGTWKRLLTGKSARIIVTMGMPAFFYSLYYRGHSIRSLKRNILELVGIHPVRTSLVGTVESGAQGHRENWLAKVADLGRKAI
jgi:putative NADPH-quinone reductase